MMTMAKTWERLVAPTDRPLLLRPSGGTWAIAAISLILGLGESVLFLDGPVGAVFLAVSLSGAFLVRRTRPEVSLALVAGSSFATDLIALLIDRPIDVPATSVFVGIPALLSLTRNCSPRIVLGVVVTALLILPIGDLTNPIGEGSLSDFVVSTLIKTSLIAAALAVRANDARRYQRELAEQASERNRLANDIHDSVAHHMSAIAIRAEAALQYSASDEVHEALGDIKRSASTGLSDMRHLVTALRQDSPDGGPLPGLGRIRQLAVEATTRQLVVTVDIEADAEIVPLAISTVAYAISREAMTNVRRHAVDASAASIVVRHTGSTLDVRISDNGVTSPTVAAVGNGLISMNQRAAEVDGMLTAGPNPSGGWLVAVRFPIDSDSE